MATYKVIGLGDNEIRVGNIDVQVSIPEIKELIEKIPTHVHVAAPILKPEFRVDTPIVKVRAPDVHVEAPQVTVYPKNEVDVYVDLKEIKTRIDIPKWIKVMLIVGVSGLYLLLLAIVSIIVLSVYHI